MNGYRMFLRRLTDKTFSLLAVFSVVLLVAVLVVVLGPMLLRGVSAVVFRGTVEFRRMQYAVNNHGDAEKIRAETAEVEKSRQSIYEMIDRFKRGIDTKDLIDKARGNYREYKKQLRYKKTAPEEYLELTEKVRQFRDSLCGAYVEVNKSVITKTLDKIISQRKDERFNNSAAAKFFVMASEYKEMIGSIDLSRRKRYSASLAEIRELLRKMLGPGPGEPTPALIMERYGATRWDMAQKCLHKLLWDEQWVRTEPGKPLEKKLLPRSQQFAGTELEQLFPLIQKDLPRLLKPRWTFYWRYFIDDSTEGHYFGGVGPEILGTLMFTLLALVFAVPFGVISASYLVECSGDNVTVRIIRTCVNTLAGVPSIVFGLFGLIFFVLYLMPALGQQPKPCILTASMTLAVLILPVIIRASEEAIRSVPQTYKEASLALGAGRFRTFVTVTLPVALPGILTGIILSLSRAAGETAPILFAGAVAGGPIAESLFEPSRTLSYGSYDIAVGDRYAMMVPHKQFGMIMTLILLVLCMNIVAIVIRSRTARKLRGY